MNRREGSERLLEIISRPAVDLAGRKSRAIEQDLRFYQKGGLVGLPRPPVSAFDGLRIERSGRVGRRDKKQERERRQPGKHVRKPLGPVNASKKHIVPAMWPQQL
ncbi:hypothetical protein [Rhodoblastus sp.]|uniref:hypothetical protein n=1 Tax=Rhodoblastus sp. TaxID=1962975 RepID=UPI003F9EA319